MASQWISKTGSELIIVDNGDEDWKVVRCLRDRRWLSRSIDIAAACLEIGSLLALPEDPHLD